LELKKIDILVKCGELDKSNNGHREQGISDYLRALSINPTKNISISTIEQLDQISLEDYDCVGLIYGKGCLVSSEMWRKDYQNVAPHFRRN
jgi:hypothetical protein